MSEHIAGSRPVTPRDARGRFTTAQHADALAAERLLERAVAEAVRLMRRGVYRIPAGSRVEGDHVYLAEHTLLAAGRSAELLTAAGGDGR